jgi:HSP20 family protein
MLTGWREFDQTLRALDSLQRRMDHSFDPGFPINPRHGRIARRPRAEWPAVNAFEAKEAFVYKALVPGLTDGDVSVYVEDNALVLRGERKSNLPEKHDVHVRERPSVAFARTLPLPSRVDAASVTAVMKDGILTVTLPKAKEALPRQIAVKTL